MMKSVNPWTWEPDFEKKNSPDEAIRDAEWDLENEIMGRWVDKRCRVPKWAYDYITEVCKKHKVNQYVLCVAFFKFCYFEKIPYVKVKEQTTQNSVSPNCLFYEADLWYYWVWSDEDYKKLSYMWMLLSDMLRVYEPKLNYILTTYNNETTTYTYKDEKSWAE